MNILVTVMVLLKMGPMGPRGLGPNPFSTVSKQLFRVGILGVPKKIVFVTFPVTVMVLLKMGPMGPRGLGPNHFSSLSQNYFVFFRISGVPKIKIFYIS